KRPTSLGAASVPQSMRVSVTSAGACAIAGRPMRTVAHKPTANRIVALSMVVSSHRESKWLQLNHPHPEHGLAGHVDIVLAYEGELAVVADAEDRQTGRDGPDRVAVSHVHREIVLGHEHASTRIDVKRARMDGARLDVLYRRWLAGGLVDRVHRDAVLAALEHLLALVLHGVLGSIRPIEKPAVRMHVNRAGRLTGSTVLRLG